MNAADCRKTDLGGQAKYGDARLDTWAGGLIAWFWKPPIWCSRTPTGSRRCATPEAVIESLGSYQDSTTGKTDAMPRLRSARHRARTSSAMPLCGPGRSGPSRRDRLIATKDWTRRCWRRSAQPPRQVRWSPALSGSARGGPEPDPPGADRSIWSPPTACKTWLIGTSHPGASGQDRQGYLNELTFGASTGGSTHTTSARCSETWPTPYGPAYAELHSGVWRQPTSTWALGVYHGLRRQGTCNSYTRRVRLGHDLQPATEPATQPSAPSSASRRNGKPATYKMLMDAVFGRGNFRRILMAANQC